MMLTLKTGLRPSAAQARLMARHIGYQHWVYNQLLVAAIVRCLNRWCLGHTGWVWVWFISLRRPGPTRFPVCRFQAAGNRVASAGGPEAAGGRE